ncbi:unnamed protein product, partial [Ectocarpus sp. 12 AP-2014]
MVCAERTALACPPRPGAQADAGGVCAGVRRYGLITPSVGQDPLGNVPDGEGFPCRPAQGSLQGAAEDRLPRPVLLSTAGLDIDWHRRVLHSLCVGGSVSPTKNANAPQPCDQGVPRPAHTSDHQDLDRTVDDWYFRLVRSRGGAVGRVRCGHGRPGAQRG